jgi:hypothetical protein
MIKDGFGSAGAEILPASSGKQVGINVWWQTRSNRKLTIAANFSDEEISTPHPVQQEVIWNSHSNAQSGTLCPRQIIVCAPAG